MLRKTLGFHREITVQMAINLEKNKDWGFICKFFQIGTCSHSKDHNSGGRKYSHVVFTLSRWPSCKRVQKCQRKKRVRHRIFAYLQCLISQKLE